MGGGGGGGAAHATFGILGCISPETLQVIQEQLRFERTTPVQQAVIPLFCGNKDVAVDACTGSGKTLAFVVPIIEKLRRLEEPLKKHQVGAIVVSPTRELARQIASVAQAFVDSVPGLTSQLLVGGSDPSEDVAAFKAHGAHVIIGTPGRIDDVMKRLGGAMETKRLEVFVLDEADRLLEMGFKAQLDAIMARLPKQRRTGLFSATQTEAVQALARAGLRNPVRVNVAVTATAPPQPAPPATSGKQAKGKGGGDGPAAAAADGAAPQPALQQKTPTGLSITYTVCDVDQKLNQLVQFLAQHAHSGKVIVYCLTCACVDFYALALKRLAAALGGGGAGAAGAGGGSGGGAGGGAAGKAGGTGPLKGIEVRALHGRMKQSVREATLEDFTKLPSGVLLATDLAARGLDIPEVQWVLQLDPPQDPSAFVHRVGRTARAGRAGRALVYLAPHEASYVDFLRLRKVPLTEAEPLVVPGEWDTPALLRRESEADREMMEVGMKAFVSFVRGYKEHHCRFIFRVQDLPIGPLATAFALLRLPHMPEVKRALVRTASGKRAEGIATCEGFTPSQVDPDTVPFKDKQREKQRQKVLKQREEQQLQQQQQQQQQQQRGKQKQHAPQQHAAANGESGSRLTAAKRRKLVARDELDELDAEYKLLKKLKRGKLSEHEFDVATGLSSDEEEEESQGRPGGGGGAAAGKPAAGKRRVAEEEQDDSSDDDEEEGGAGRRAAAPGRQQSQGSAGGGGSGGGGKKVKGPALPSQQHLQQHLDAKRKRKKRRMHKQQQHQAGS